MLIERVREVADAVHISPVEGLRELVRLDVGVRKGRDDILFFHITRRVPFERRDARKEDRNKEKKEAPVKGGERSCQKM
jgi:hypothetical protein